ncbi:MAG: pentapeptide repeat-containing protein [Verrucomicrobia bacterium]|nr:pentapeptide repeat-containing protein [Verrucomicrobiota bacterium]
MTEQLYKLLDKDGRDSAYDGTRYPLPEGSIPGAWAPPVRDPKILWRGYQLTSDLFVDAAASRGPQRLFLVETKGKVRTSSRRVAAESVRLVHEITPDWEELPVHPELRALLTSLWRKENGPAAALPQWASLTTLWLDHQNLTHASFSGVSLAAAVCAGSDLSGADLRRADLTLADFTGASLFRADVSGATLTGARLRRADAKEADFRGAALNAADLRRANLSGADLRNVDLRRTSVRGAKLSGADLRGARISRAQLLTCRYWWEARLEGAMIDGEVWPSADEARAMIRSSRPGRAL